MEFGLSEEQTLLVDTVNRFLDDASPLDRVRKFAADPNDTDIWQGLVDIGISGLLVSEDAGGTGLRHVEAALVAEALGNHVTPSPYLGSAVVLPSVLNATDPGATLLGELAAGKVRCGLALSGATGARAGTAVVARNGRLTGKVAFVLDYPASVYLVADAAGSLHLVDANASGLSHRRLTTVDASRPVGEIVLADSPATCLSNDPEVLARALDVARVMLAADTLGAAQNMLDQAVAYALQREQFDRPIATFQAVKHMCAEMAADLEPCRAFVWYAAHALDELPDEARLTACHLKAHIAEVGQFVSKTATEVHGGMGFTDLVGLHYWFKRIGLNRQVLGTPEWLRDEAARLQGLVA